MSYSCEFVSYDGEFPNLCHGCLVVRVNGKLYAMNNLGDYRKRSCIVNNPEITKVKGIFLCSGGQCFIDDDVIMGKWSIDFDLEDDDSPFNDKELQEALVDCVNENIHYGCCGGCR